VVSHCLISIIARVYCMVKLREYSIKTGQAMDYTGASLTNSASSFVASSLPLLIGS